MQIFFIGFAVLFILFIGTIVTRFIKNENSPIIATKARLVDKKSDFHMHTDANGAAHSSESLYLIFELDTSSTMRFSVSGRVYRSVAMHEWGTLTFQGTRFLKFESQSGTTEK